MEGQTFNFKDFLKKCITEATTLEDMQLMQEVTVDSVVTSIFNNEEQFENIIGNETEAELVVKCDEAIHLIVEALNYTQYSSDAQIGNVSSVFLRTLGLHVAVYAGLLENYCLGGYLDDDPVALMEKVAQLKRYAEELSVTNKAEGIWNMPKTTCLGNEVFKLSNMKKLIKQFKSTIDEFVENVSKKAIETDNSDEPADEKEMLAAWRKADWANIEPTISSLLKTIGTLYRSGIESMAQPGILLNNGEEMSPLVVVKYNEAEEGKDAFCGMENKIDSGMRTDLKIIRTIAETLPNLAPMQGIDPKTNFPTLAALYSNEGIMHKAHLMFQSVSIPFSGKDHNINSIKCWIRETKDVSGEEWIKTENRGNHKRINKYKDAEAWFRWVLENTLFRYFNEAGLKPDKPTASALDTVDKISEIFARKFKNIIVVSERESKGKTLQSTELRIASDSNYDPVMLSNNIAKALNTGNAKDITATPRNTVNQVTAVRIVYDQAAANAATVFASEIAQSLIDGGNTPKWNKVLLGRTQNGEFLFWEDFMYGKQAADRAYAIYAGSGAGKGIMTLTLMAAAISDKKQLFYTDGKPDSGASIGALAWKAGKEMYMFDGQPQGGDAFPGYLETNPVTNGLRDAQETLKYTASIPKGIFVNEAQVREFLGVCRYLRSLSLCADILTARGGKGLLKNSTNPEEDFQIWVFDEMTSMSGHERSVRQTFASYIKNKGYKFAMTKKDADGVECLIGLKGGKDYNETIDSSSDKYDAGVAYIADWLHWLASINPKMKDLSVIGLRNAQANIFFIFQNAEWLSNEKDGEITTIAKTVQALQCRKFVGANGLAKACGHYGDGNTMRTEWASVIAGGGGWWAVSNASDIRQEGTKMTIFKPYSIWGFRKPGAVGNDERYLDYYCDLILAGRVSAGEVLQSAWNYAEQAVQFLSSGDAKVINPVASLKDYIYNVERFSLEGEAYDPNSLSNAEIENKDFTDFADEYNQNLLENLAQPIENTNEDIDFGADLDIEEEPIVVPPIERRNDGFDDAREELAKEKAQQQSEIDRLLNLGQQSKMPQPITTPTVERVTMSTGMSQNELTERLKSMAGLSGDEQQRELEKLGRDLAAAGFNIHPNMPTVTKDEADKAGTVEAYDTAEVFSRDAQGRRIMDASKLPADTKQVLHEGKNYRSFPHPVLPNSFFESNNTKKLDKAKGKAWKDFVARAIKDFGGRNTIMALVLTENDIIINGMLIDHGFMENNYISSLAQVADIKYMLEQFTALNTLSLTPEMLNAFFVQTSDMYENPECKATNRTFEEYVFLSLCPKLNKFTIAGASPKTITRAQFVEARKNKKRMQSPIYKNMKQLNEARRSIGNVKSAFIKKNTGKYHLSDTQSRYKASQVKYKGGIFGRALYNLLDRMSPDA